MKKYGMFLMLAMISLSSFAQNEPVVAQEKNVLKVNTLPLLIGTGSIFYERELSDMMAAQLGIAYLNYRVNDTKFSGLILTPEIKFYVRNDAVDGFYVSPYLRYNKFSYSVTESTGKGEFSAFGGGLMFGRQWIMKKGFVMDLFFGGHYTDGSWNVQSGESAPDVNTFEGFKTRIGFAIGFAF